MDVVVVPTNKPMVRQDMPDAIFATEKGKYHAIIEKIIQAHDIRCAHNAGVKAVLADWGVTDPLKNADPEDLPDSAIEDPIQLLGVIRSM